MNEEPLYNTKPENNFKSQSFDGKTVSSYKWTQDKYGNWVLEKCSKEDTSKTQSKTEENNDIKVLDNTERIKPEGFVMTEWGVGRVKKIENGKVTVTIEGNPVEFSKETISTHTPVYLCILSKDVTYWVSLKIEYFYTIAVLKSKIAQFMKCHHSQIVIVHNGAKVDKKGLSLIEMGIYENVVILVVIKDPQELMIVRTKAAKTINKAVNYNALKFSVPHDIIITGVGFYKNKTVDVFYDLFIFEEIGNNTKLVFSEKKVIVRKDEFEENEVYKHRINNIEIKANTTYQIHQYLSKTEKNQYFGLKGTEAIEEKSTLISFKFSNCEIPGRTNSTDIEEGMIPAIYFYVI